MKKTNREEFVDIISEMLMNEKYALLSEYKHHKKDIITHNIYVAWMTYKITKFLHLDYVSATRGAMLHDFFHYNWREMKRNILDFTHTKSHPIISYENAVENFKINPLEKDIIVKHMFPLTLRPPKYMESIIVSLVDKIVATCEFISVETANLEFVEVYQG